MPAVDTRAATQSVAEIARSARGVRHLQLPQLIEISSPARCLANNPTGHEGAVHGGSLVSL